MAKVKVTALKCRRCGHRWLPRTSDVALCPKCRSPRWDTTPPPTRPTAA